LKELKKNSTIIHTPGFKNKSIKKIKRLVEMWISGIIFLIIIKSIF